MATPGNELHDISDPQPLLPGIEVPLWFWIVLVAFVFGAASFLLFFFLRRQAPPPAPGTSFYGESKSALEHLRESLGGRHLAEVATEASLILRHYLAVAMEEPALYETHEEFVMRSDALVDLPAGARDRLAPLLDHLAAAKYGPSSSQDDLSHQLVDSCLEVLQGIESTRARKVA